MNFMKQRTWNNHKAGIDSGRFLIFYWGKKKEEGFDRIDLIKNILPVYLEILRKLYSLNGSWIQFDEPFLVTDLSEKEKQALNMLMAKFRKAFPSLRIILATYFGSIAENLDVVAKLQVSALHIDLVGRPNIRQVLDEIPEAMTLSIGNCRW